MFCLQSRTAYALLDSALHQVRIIPIFTDYDNTLTTDHSDDLSVLSTLCTRPSNSHGKSLKPQSLFSMSKFLSKTIIWQPVFTTNPQIRTVTYCTHPPTNLKTRFRTPIFSGSVDSAAMIQTLTPDVMKCLISFLNVTILTTSYLKHSIVSKTSIENPLQNHQPQTMKNEFLSHSLSTLTI